MIRRERAELKIKEIVFLSKNKILFYLLFIRRYLSIHLFFHAARKTLSSLVWVVPFFCYSFRVLLFNWFEST